MSSTPGRENVVNFTDNLTPVRFLDSPRLKSNSEDANFSACKVRLGEIVLLLQTNYSKWLVAQKRGTAICTSIEAIKTRAIEVKEPSSQTNSDIKVTTDTLYPNDLKLYVDRLNIILSIFEDITKSAKKSLQQLISLSKLAGTSDKIFYRTWKLVHYINFLEQLYACYEKESSVKQFVARELPHCMNRADLIRCTTAWEYPQYIDEWTSLNFALLKEEIK
ncbi:uncharacterized protein LOC128865443 [Anastrepha ludens]|uniref:uncharacterized protein LOC128865443 n=1 Tax=Anastrepha ludens TaxID=28586 RepID=UPI0023AF385B|nr:uncharacterized protein LOC128865443 [Anastrepha ludens]